MTLHPTGPVRLSRWRRLAASFGLLCVAVATGCGASALDNATTTLGTLRAAQGGVVETFEAGVEADLEAHCGEALDLRGCAQARVEHWRDLESGINAAADTLDALTSALLAWAEQVHAGQGDADDPPLPVCQSLSSLVAITETWTEVLGHRLPVEPWECGQ